DRGGADGRRHAMGAVQDDRVLRNFVDVIDEDDAALLESLDHVAIVHDFVIDVNRRAEQFKNLFQAVDGHVDTGAKPARVGENDSHSLSSLDQYILAGMDAKANFIRLARKVKALGAWSAARAIMNSAAIVALTAIRRSLS